MKVDLNWEELQVAFYLSQVSYKEPPKGKTTNTIKAIDSLKKKLEDAIINYKEK
jgi:hypothetical protein